MGLNNIDSEYLRNTKLINIFNVSSWGLQVGEVKQLLSILDLTNVKQVIYSTQYFDFKKHLKVIPFQIAEEGVLEAQEYHTADHRLFSIHYLVQADFVLTWCVDKL
jgi:hypothetical protein